MKYLGLSIFLFLVSCSKREKYFSSIEDAIDSIEMIIKDGDVDEFLTYSDRSNLPDHITDKIIEETIIGLFSQAEGMNFTEVILYSKTEYEEYCKKEYEKIPESFRHQFNEKPMWNRAPNKYLVYRYGSSETLTLKITVGLFKVDEGWRIASGYYPERKTSRTRGS